MGLSCCLVDTTGPGPHPPGDPSIMACGPGDMYVHAAGACTPGLGHQKLQPQPADSRFMSLEGALAHARDGSNEGSALPPSLPLPSALPFPAWTHGWSVRLQALGRRRVPTWHK